MSRLSLAEVVDFPAPAGSPMWRRDRLLKKLEERRQKVTVLESYYDGDHPLPTAPARMQTFAEARQAFENLSRLGVTNYMPPVVDVVEQRLRVTGFRFGQDAQADDEAWRIWQRNHLDADSQLVHHNALMTGQAFMLVWPVDGLAQITPEHPAQTIIEYAPGSLRERAAGLRSWCEDDESRRAVLYLPAQGSTPGEVYKWQADNEHADWKPWQPSTDDTWPIKNPMGVVPLVEFRANRSLRPAPFGGGASEFAGVINDQNRINKTVFDRLVTAEFQAFRQRWAVGWTPDSPNEALRASVSRLLSFEDAEVKVGEFTQADFSPFLAAVAADVEAIGARTSTPFYALGKLANPPSGDALMALQSGLIAKSKKHRDNFTESHEEVMALALQAEGKPGADDFMATALWDSVTFVTFAEKADAAVKYKAADVPMEAIWSDVLGFSPQDIARFRIMRASAALLEPDASGVQ